jgi:hypothetical protein
MARLVFAALFAASLLLSACSARAPRVERGSGESAGSKQRYERLRAPLFIRDVGFDTPESVLHDTRSDRYLVSNVAGPALESDDRAFISRLRPDGSVEALHWIDASQHGVELNAPKGMALSDDTLFIADITQVRKFDRASGKPLGSVSFPGAAFLNDLTIDSNGMLYASDSGLGPGYRPLGSDAVHRMDGSGMARPFVRSAELGGPSGLSSTEGGLWVASFGSGEVFFLNVLGQRSQIAQPPRGSLDGLAVWNDRLFVSSWEGAAVYERTADGFAERISGVDAAADLAIDEPRARLLITHYRENALSIHQL